MRGPAFGFRRIKRTYLYLRRANRLRVSLFISAVFLTVVLVVMVLVLAVQDVALSGAIFPGVTIDGKPVGGMSREEAVEFVRSSVAAPLSQELVLTYDEEEFRLDPKQIGLTIDIEGMVDDAFRKGNDRWPVSRMLRRFFNKPVSVNVPIKLEYNKEALNSFVVGIAETLNRDPVSSSLSMNKKVPYVSESEYGLAVDQEATTGRIVAALPVKRKPLKVVTSGVKPEVTEEDIGYIIVIRQGEHKLYLYNGNELVDTFAVATGTEKYPTPNGSFTIIKKEKDPTWYPPKSEWAKDKKPIPPGPGNPLGPYWMGIADDIGIHSTPDEKSLGYSSSHGCIRLSEWAAMYIFNRVKEGTRVYIYPPDAPAPAQSAPAAPAPPSSSPAAVQQ